LRRMANGKKAEKNCDYAITTISAGHPKGGAHGDVAGREKKKTKMRNTDKA